MTYRTNLRHDAFSFSLAGMSAVGAAIAPPIVPNDRIARAWDAKLNGGASDKPAPSQAAGGCWLRRLAPGSAGP